MHTVIACFSVALINTMTKSNLREVIFHLMEDNILSSTSKSCLSLREVRTGTQGRNLKAET